MIVSKATLTITANDATKTYGDVNPALTVKYSGFVNGDDATKLTTQPTVTTTATDESAVGTYPITAVGAASNNYAITYVPGTLTISKAPLTITANNASKVYGAANPTFSVSYNGFVNGDDSSVLTTQPTITTIATASSAAGTYSITVSGAVAANYEITYVAGTLTITKASQSIALSSIPAQTYGAAAYTLPTTTAQGQTLTWTVANTAIATVSGNTLTIKKAGSTKVTATQAGGTNYNAFSKEFTLTVNKVPLTITANDATKKYGASIPTLTVSYDGFVNGDSAAVLTTQPTVTTTATASSAVGTYPITASGAASDNYEISYVAGVLTISKASQSMALSSIPAQTYGAAAYPLPTTTAQGQTLTWTVANTAIATVSGNTLTIKEAGSTKVTATQSGNTNYNAFSKEFTLTVNKAALTIAADDKTKEVGDENPALTVTYTGFVNGDNASSLTTQPTVTTTATKDSPVGTYPITASGATSDNYNISYVNGTLTVTDAFVQDNTLTGIDTKGLVGTQATLEIVLTNADVVSLCQFDLRLPEGVTVALNNKNKLDATLSDRASTHSISSKQLANGDYRFVLSSLDGDAFTGHEGTLVNIVLDIADDAETGNQIVKVLNIELSVPVGNDLKIVNPADAESILTISDYTPGDVNNDGKVSVTDVGYAINYILEQVPSVFIFDAADMNHDGKVTVTDVGYIINLILSDSSNSRVDGLNGAATLGSVAHYATQRGIAAIENTGMKHLFSIASAEDYIGFQMDVTLPKGISLTAARLDAMSNADHALTFRQVAENMYRIVCYSLSNSSLSHAADALLTLSTTAATDGLRVTDILFTTVSLDEVSFIIGDATDIVGTGWNESAAPLFDMQGRRMDATKSLRKGIYVSEGRKSIWK